MQRTKQWRSFMRDHITIMDSCDSLLKLPTVAFQFLNCRLPTDAICCVAHHYSSIYDTLVKKAFYRSTQAIYEVMLGLCPCARRNAIHILLDRLTKLQRLKLFVQTHEPKLYHVFLQKADELHSVLRNEMLSTKRATKAQIVLTKLAGADAIGTCEDASGETQIQQREYLAAFIKG
jgi:arginyl-tRNA--protein-N-Asp/Glu arginylyltransferase